MATTADEARTRRQETNLDMMRLIEDEVHPSLLEARVEVIVPRCLSVTELCVTTPTLFMATLALQRCLESQTRRAHPISSGPIKDNWYALRLGTSAHRAKCVGTRDGTCFFYAGDFASMIDVPRQQVFELPSYFALPKWHAIMARITGIEASDDLDSEQATTELHAFLRTRELVLAKDDAGFRLDLFHLGRPQKKISEWLIAKGYATPIRSISTPLEDENNNVNKTTTEDDASTDDEGTGTTTTTKHVKGETKSRKKKRKTRRTRRSATGKKNKKRNER